MSKKKNNNPKRAAYAAKQEQEGRNVVKWIIGVLVALGVIFLGYAVMMTS